VSGVIIEREWAEISEGTFAPSRALPAFPGLRRVVGPGIILLALAQGSGELVWWPYIVAKYGLAFVFLLVPAHLIQGPLLFEIGRYTVLTGEGVFRGFFRMNKAVGVGMWILFTISFLWFGGFAVAGGQAVASVTGWPRGWSPERQGIFWGQWSIVVFTLAILWAKTVYKLIEWVMRVIAVVSLVGMILACSNPVVASQAGRFLKGMIWPDVAEMRTFDAKTDATRLLTAITFAGLGGFWTMFYSYWLKEKGAGMAAHMQNITGFRSGVAHIRTGEPALPLGEAGARRELKRWYRYLSFETFVGLGGNLLTTIMTCLLAFALLHPQRIVPTEQNLVLEQAAFFQVSWGTVGRVIFLIVAGCFLADTWLATVDGVARIHLDSLAAVWPGFRKRDIRPWYYGMVLALAVVTSVTMFFKQPGTLILISAVIGVVGTVVYSLTLVAMNHRWLKGKLPLSLRPGWRSLAALVVSCTAYLALAGLYFWNVRGK
jgi:hypothetical protein